MHGRDIDFYISRVSGISSENALLHKGITNNFIIVVRDIKIQDNG